mgnify:FL=1
MKTTFSAILIKKIILEDTIFASTFCDLSFLIFGIK